MTATQPQNPSVSNTVNGWLNRMSSNAHASQQQGHEEESQPSKVSTKRVFLFTLLIVWAFLVGALYVKFTSMQQMTAERTGITDAYWTLSFPADSEQNAAHHQTPFSNISLVSAKQTAQSTLKLSQDTSRLDPSIFHTDISHFTNPAHCPPSRPALIGILSTAEYSNTARRLYLRQQYARLNSFLPPSEKVDVVFVLPKPTSIETRYHLHLEAAQYPNDTFLAPESDSASTGLILDWIRAARQLSYEAVSVAGGNTKVVCQKYSYIGKASDDAVIHLGRLSKRLRAISDANSLSRSQFIGRVWGGSDPNNDARHMTGMLYLASIDIAEYLYWSRVPIENKNGIPDLQFARWMRKEKLEVDWLDQTDAFYYSESEPSDADILEKVIAARNLTQSTVVVPGCSTNAQFFECLKSLDIGV
ncbi:hypothetical protein BJ741DRAFT_604563 [Chytriomyces cf. hyalinus JEL632]|nr:hypothetical protein BJ741DRAFT_604563 [Chytriomyces cf. hyalinus JEL632]